MTQDPHIVYEQPVSELLRVCLKLETCFTLIKQRLTTASEHDSFTAIATLIETLNFVDRPDLKTKLNQEFQRHFESLSRLTTNSGVDQGQLNTILAQLEHLIERIVQSPGKFGKRLRENKFLAHVAQHLEGHVPFPFDTPALHFWLQQPEAQRVADLNEWVQPFALLDEAVTMLLQLTRESSRPEPITAESGFYQTPLDNQNNCQLIRLAIPQGKSVFPEISVGRHRMSIRFVIPSMSEKTRQTLEDIDFLLTRCIL